MRNRKGYGAHELADLSRRRDLREDENLLRVMDGESDCTSWRYPYYAVNRSCRFVLGFVDESECDGYCAENGYVKLSLTQACVAARKPNIYGSWSSSYPTNGLL